MPPARPMAEAFWEKVEPEPNSGCFIWTGATTRGYGRMTISQKAAIATRVSWELHYGAIPTGYDVLHKCDQPWCVNPQHLFLGTAQDNIRDARNKGRLWQQRVAHCPQGHPYDSANTYINHGRRWCRVCLQDARRRRVRARIAHQEVAH